MTDSSFHSQTREPFALSTSSLLQTSISTVRYSFPIAGITRCLGGRLENTRMEGFSEERLGNEMGGKLGALALGGRSRKGDLQGSPGQCR